MTAASSSSSGYSTESNAPDPMFDNQLILTADPDFVDLALRELRAAQDVRQADELADGVFHIELNGTFWDLAEQWRQDPPIFVRHICPAQVIVPLALAEADVEGFQRIVADDIVPLMTDELSFSVQTRTYGDLPYKRFTVNNALADVIQRETGAPLDVRAPQQIVSVVCAAIGAECNAYLGLSLAAHNLSDWAGGMRRFARADERVSRSEFKLLEAIDVFDLELPPRGTALDLGAAPGGWTRVLRQHDQYVTAVDPGALHPSISADRRVRHRRMTAEEYLTDEPDQFDVIVNDMRIDAGDSARLMVAYAPYLYRHGWALVTLKLPEQGRMPIIDDALTILRQAYRVVGARQLFHNRSEITVYLQPLPHSPQ